MFHDMIVTVLCRGALDSLRLTELPSPLVLPSLIEAAGLADRGRLDNTLRIDMFIEMTVTGVRQLGDNQLYS